MVPQWSHVMSFRRVWDAEAMSGPKAVIEP